MATTARALTTPDGFDAACDWMLPGSPARGEPGDATEQGLGGVLPEVEKRPPSSRP